MSTSPEMRYFERRLGKWTVAGALSGTSVFEKVEGDMFFVNSFDFIQNGIRSRGIEVFGHEKAFGQEPSKHFTSRIYDYISGLTQDYVHELNEQGFITWLGQKGSSIWSQGIFDESGKVMQIAWNYPGGSYTVSFRKTE